MSSRKAGVAWTERTPGRPDAVKATKPAVGP